MGPLRDMTPLPDLLHGAARAGPVRTRGRSTWTCCRRATRAARRARTSRPGWRTSQAGGTSRRGGSWSPTTRCRPSTAGSATTRARASATGPSWTAPCRSTRSSGSWATWRWSGAGRSSPPPSPPAGGCWWSAPGPSGLSAAYHLARLGHQVEIRDAAAEPGGMMRYGIPAYRLPRDVLAAEIDRIAALGVTITCGHRVEDLAAERRDGGFDAVFVAVGAHLSKRVDIPARDAGRIVDAVPFLRERRLRRAPGDRPPGRGLRRRQHRDGRRPGGPAAGRRRDADRLPAHPRADARSRGRGRRRPNGKACGSTGCARSPRSTGPS